VICLALALGQDQLVVPIPESVDKEGCCVALGDLSYSGPGHAWVQQAWSRQQKLSAPSDGSKLPVRVTVASNVTESDLDKELPDADVSYSLRCGKDGCDVNAKTVYGALYGVDTLSQFYASGQGPTHLKVSDRPSHNYRGLMVDAGRRFVPNSFLEETLDGMFAARLNVLHLHLSDFGRLSLDLPGMAPEDPSDRKRGRYTKADIQKLVSDARSRGVRVLPEVDVPGHALGLKGFPGLKFCEADVSAGGVRPERATALFDDSDGTTRGALRRLFSEVVQFFDDPMVHMGGDEAGGVGACTTSNGKALESFVSSALLELKRTPVAWGDLAAKDEVSKRVVMEPWNSAYEGRHDVVDANIHYSYLDFTDAPARNFWHRVDARGNKLIGGEAAIWTDNWCFAYQCGAASEDVGREVGKTPKARGMFDRYADDTFSSSLAGVVWPRAYVKGASLWRYDASTDVSQILRVADERLKGVDACPLGCECDEVTRCGSVYPVPQKNDEAVQGCFQQQSLRGQRTESAKDLPSALRLCTWRGCDGVVCDDDCWLLDSSDFGSESTAYVPIAGCLEKAAPNPSFRSVRKSPK